MIKTDSLAQLIPSERKGLMFVGVYSPWRVDTQNEAILPEELENTAHEFAFSGKLDRIDQEHNNIVTGCRIVQTFISQKGDMRFPIPGTWGVAIQLTDQCTADVEAGKINGVSLEWKTPPHKADYPTLVSHPVFGTGITEVSLAESDEVPEHYHTVELRFDPKTARIIPTITGEALGHVHNIIGSTSTEPTRGHAHRLDLEPSSESHHIEIEYERRIQVVTYLFNLIVDWISLVRHGANWTPLEALKTDSYRRN